MTAEGLFLEALMGVPPPPAKSSDENDEEDEKKKMEEVRNGLPGGQMSGNLATREEQLEATKVENFDWEKAWRAKNQVSKFRSGQGFGQRRPFRGRGSSSSHSRDRRRPARRPARNG